MNLSIETDCEELLAGLSSGTGDCSPICFLLKELKDKLHGCHDFSIGWVGRDGNRLAHDLASFARTSGTSDLLVGSLPGLSGI